jgi:hypothetical protein
MHGDKLPHLPRRNDNHPRCRDVVLQQAEKTKILIQPPDRVFEQFDNKCVRTIYLGLEEDDA